MDKKTYRSTRRMIIAEKIAETAEALHGLRLSAIEEAELEEMAENIIEVELEDDE
jgi:hypothetical protein